MVATENEEGRMKQTSEPGATLVVDGDQGYVTMPETEADTGGREALGSLRLLQDFVNTRDVAGGRDEVGGPEAMQRWLVANGLLEAEEPVSREEFERALKVREALRAMLLANSGGPTDSDAAAVLNE